MVRQPPPGGRPPAAPQALSASDLSRIVEKQHYMIKQLGSDVDRLRRYLGQMATELDKLHAQVNGGRPATSKPDLRREFAEQARRQGLKRR